MTTYTSCFLGIPLPQRYQKEFEQLLLDIQSIDPLIEIVQPLTPHITIYYLDKQSQYSLDEINQKIQSFTKDLSDTTLKTKGLGYFTQDNPHVLFLDVIYPKSLIEYKNNVSEIFKEYSASDNNLPFHPHV